MKPELDHIMPQAQATPSPAHSPLMICDRLISLAQDADRAGYTATADRLVDLVEEMFAERQAPRRADA